jgi:hypothetical protein
MKLSIRLSNMGMAALAGCLVLVLMFALVLSRPMVVQTASSDRVEAREFILRDSAGRERIRIAVDDNDSPGITLLDKSGTRRALLRLNQDDMPSLRMYDAAGKVDSVLGYDLKHNEPALVFFNSFGIGRLASDPTGMLSSSLEFRDEDLYPNWRSGLPLQSGYGHEWHIAPEQETSMRAYRSSDLAPLPSNSIQLDLQCDQP